MLLSWKRETYDIGKSLCVSGKIPAEAQKEESATAQWQTLTDVQQRFLLAAHDMDADLPHTDGSNRVLPVIPWRTVGVMAELTAAESDNVVASLADRQLFMIHDPATHQLYLTGGRWLVELMQSELRKKRQTRREWIIFAAATVIVVAFMVLTNRWP